MIAIREADPAPPPRTLAAALAQGVPRAYAVLFFSANARLGWVLLAVSFFEPLTGLSGLLGVGATASLAWCLGFDRANIRNGFYLFNPLLVCLTLGWIHGCYAFPPGLFALLGTAGVLGGFFLAVSLQTWFGAMLGLSAHSLPAVAATYVLYFVSLSVSGPMVLPVATPQAWLDLDFLPSLLQSLLQAFGAMLFTPRALPGLIVLAALAAASPLTCLTACAAFVAGWQTLAWLGAAQVPDDVLWCGFNFLLCGIALGSGYFVVSRASLLLALLGAFLCALVAVALARALLYFGLPASALPYNGVVLALAYALRQRRAWAGLQPSPSPGSLPESAARHVKLESLRFPHLQTPALHLPFAGERVITQSFEGALTHRGAWRHGLDFECDVDGRRHQGEGTALGDFPSFGTPVFSPCGGFVFSAVGTVHDNEPGGNNPAENWGNHVVIQSDAGFHVLLAHLKAGSLAVTPGQRVERGTLLGECGNSGRSPAPHLHLHVQAGGRAGAPTVEFCLKHFLEATARGWIYRTSAVPLAGARVRPAEADASLLALLAGWLPGEYRYRVSGEKGRSWEETLLLDFDDAGRYRITSRRSGARLTAFLAEGVFYSTGFEGDDRSLLAHLALALSRIPCLADEGVGWNDVASSLAFQRRATRWIHEGLDPFIGPATLEGAYTLGRDANGWRVRGVFAATHGVHSRQPRRAPREVVATLASRHLVRHLDVRLANDEQLVAELAEHRPFS